MNEAVAKVITVLGLDNYDLLCIRAEEQGTHINDEWIRHCGRNTLDFAMCWDDTEEGHDFWEEYHHILRDNWHNIEITTGKRVKKNGGIHYVF